MREATRYFGLRASATVLAAILLTVSASQGLSLVRVSGEQRIEARVDAVVGSTAEGLLPGIMKLEPLGEAALPRLREKFAAAPAGSVHQLHAALALALLGEPDEDFLVRSIALAPAKECRNILTALRPLTPSVVGKLLDHANVETQSAVRARYAITLLQLGDPRGAQAALALVPDPQYRTAFIHGFDAWHANLSELVNLLRRDLAETLRDNTGHPALRSGLCAALGTVDAESLEDRERKELVDLLRDLYTTDPDGGTHNAAGWALWKWTGERPSLEFPIGPSADRHWFISPHGLTLLEIPLDPGRFTWQKSDTGPHEIELTRIFYACDRGVPQRLFLKFLDEIAQDPDEEPLQEWNQDEFMRANTEPDHPVRRISWFDAVRFCNWLSRKEGKQACYTFEGNESKVVNGKQRNWPIWRFDRDADGYRLPTAAESEYACRAGSATQYFFGDDRDTELLLHYGWFAGNSGERVHAGGEKPPNGWGLFDVYGNLLEWCWDWQWEGSTMTQWVDPLGPPEGTLRVTRGHFFGSGHSFLKGSASRFELRPDVRILGAGFRVVCGPPSPRH
jgi:formylglycine-generating enzyme required for sulfatase activity